MAEEKEQQFKSSTVPKTGTAEQKSQHGLSQMIEISQMLTSVTFF